MNEMNFNLLDNETVLEERTRSGAARHRARMTSSALRLGAGELHIMHKHELSLSQRGPKEPELPAKSGTADTCCSVCVIWRTFRNLEHKAVDDAAVCFGSRSQWVNTPSSHSK
ncbi:hypothetical protein Q8A67_024960 [Cirrhinus molitorella]|uniref:Uncharacterized protein n=1 Tax=Cirrhinus molitorella TaxID=172907 RepID=A0AA88NYX9_9TELE|nr:hypothetical protein Q8A67_024960 [Cirrhinus molitorella]